MLVIAPLFGIAQMVYYFGIAEYLLGMDKGSKAAVTQVASTAAFNSPPSNSK